MPFWKPPKLFEIFTLNGVDLPLHFEQEALAFVPVAILDGLDRCVALADAQALALATLPAERACMAPGVRLAAWA